MRILRLAALLLFSVFAGFGAANAASFEKFDKAAFAAAQQQGKPILVDVHATWCPTCKKQEKVLGALKNEAAYANLIIFQLDYDKQKDVWKSMGVRKQSTLIAFKGSAETGRSVGVTKKEEIQALIATAMK